MAYHAFLCLLFLPISLSQGFIPATFPQCANDCLAKFNNGTFIGNCAVGDAACVCAESSFQDGWACCVNTGCNEADEASAIGTMKSQCPTSPNIGSCAAGRDPGRSGGGRGGGRFGGGGGRFGGGGGGQPADPVPPVTVTAPAVPVTVVSPVTINNPVTVVPSPVIPDTPLPVSTPIEVPAPVSVAPVPFSTVAPAPAPATITTTSVLTSLQEIVVTSLVSDAALPSPVPSDTLLSTPSVEQPSVLSTNSVGTATTGQLDTLEGALPSTTLFSSTVLPTGTPPSPILSPTNTDKPSPSKPMTDGQKAGIAIAVLVTVALIAIGAYFFMRWRKRSIDKEFEELKEQHEANKARPKSKALPVYPRTDTTVVGGVGAYRDIFEKPGGAG
ncbi:hypothetical protein DL98DRAFT_598978 [Cadophora sp. DSE1049]|nr:hypothetical protein DL98DRAFT_598978 [Cadophora sp. DSE1049]